MSDAPDTVDDPANHMALLDVLVVLAGGFTRHPAEDQ